MTKQYFLLDQYPHPNSFKKIWKFGSPKPYPLFDTTALVEYKDKGPMLLAGNIENLLTDYKANPRNWSGLIITTNATDEQLLNHLRSLLFVTYPPESKGILTYYDVHTAYYLFNFTEPEYLNQWLGPIQSLHWYGGTWQQQANNQLQWLEVKQPDTRAKDPIKEFCPLTEGQQQGLLVARQHKYVFDWIENKDQDFNQTYQHFQEAIQLRFDELQYLKKYLELRAKYPQHITPIQLTGNNAQERLTNLENFWNAREQEEIYG